MVESSYQEKFFRILDKEPPNLLAKKILSAASMVRPPTDLEAICDQIGGLRIVEDNIVEDGYILSGIDGEYLVVFNSKTKHSKRYRFTIAHEIGHFALFKAAMLQFDIPSEVAVNLQFAFSHSNKKIEKWCDEFAGELLIPMEFLREVFPSREEVFNSELAATAIDLFQVSKEFFFKRLTTLFHNVVLIYYEQFSKSEDLTLMGSFPYDYPNVDSIFNEFAGEVVPEKTRITPIRVSKLGGEVLAVFIRKIHRDFSKENVGEL